jgi:hypothetical protein
MTKLSAAWLGCSFALGLLALAGCTSADKCARGEVGCACKSDQACDKGASCVDGTCTSKDGGATTPGHDSGAADASSPRHDASTQGGDAGNDMQDAGNVDCKASTFAGACREYCRALCASEANLCLDSQCEEGFCGTDGGQLRDTCDSVCGDADDPVSCMQDLCTGELDRTCEEFGYEDNGEYVSGCFNEDPACVPNPDFGCSNVCGTGPHGTGADLKNNGKCEDGGDGSVDKAPCARGTDCMDCGKRTCAQQGGSCQNGGDCCGFYPNMGAFCVDQDGNLGTDDAVCLLDCTTQACPDGTQCSALAADAGAVCAP